MSQWPKVVLIGDSLTQFSFSQDGCWGALVATALERKCDVVNRGFSGYNVRWAKIITPKLLSKEEASNVAAVTLFYGANDSVLSDVNPQQHVSLEDYKNDTKSIIDYLVSIGIAKDKIITIGAPPVDEPAWKKVLTERAALGRPMSKCNKQTEIYAEACAEVSTEIGVAHIELYKSMMANENWHEYLIDGLHFSKKGSEFLAHLLIPKLQKITSNLKTQYPEWDAVNAENPESSFN